MVPHTPVWKWVLALVVVIGSLAVAIPLGIYADRDDAPGGIVIAYAIFVVGAVVAAWIVNPRRASSRSSSN